MFRLISSLMNRKTRSKAGSSCKTSSKRFSRPRLELQALETRLVPAVILNHGGPVLTAPDVQAVFVGTDWNTNATMKSEMSSLNSFLSSVTQSSYFPMVGNAGYDSSSGVPIGKGTSEAGAYDAANLSKSTDLTDGEIQFIIQAYIENGSLKAPSSNTVYVVYVEDNIVVQAGNQYSNQGFMGYHDHFAGTNRSGQATDIHYAVIDYPGGSSGNYTLSYLSTLSTLTDVTSHELAESATDPDLNAWYDPAVSDGEVGDLVVGQVVYLNGYAVQRLADQNGQPMMPAGATTQNPVSFVLETNGTLMEYFDTTKTWTTITTGIVSISDQGIDKTGQPMVDYITTAGVAYEYHDGSATAAYGLGNSTINLGSGVASAVAGDGASYVLLKTGTLKEYRDATPEYTSASWNTIGTVPVGSTISAGTDHFGINAVDLDEFGSASVYEISDSTGWHFVATNVLSVSGGQQGIICYVTTQAIAYWFNDVNSQTSELGAAVKQVTVGSDPNGNYMIDLLFSNGQLQEYRAGKWSVVANGVQYVSKGRAGLIDIVFGNGSDDEHTANGLISLLTSGVHEAG